MANPNHDEKGKFASGSGSGPAGDKPTRTSDARGKDPATTQMAAFVPGSHEQLTHDPEGLTA